MLQILVGQRAYDQGRKALPYRQDARPYTMNSTLDQGLRLSLRPMSTLDA
jgi:hypothetical protein